MADPLKPTRVKLSIMSALATGWLPWGVNNYDGKTAGLCCGHVLNGKRPRRFWPPDC